MNKYILSKERRLEIESIFNEFDKNKNGLDGKQLIHLLKSIGIYLNKDESAALLDECRIHGNINLNNFYSIMQEFYYDENIGKLLLTSLQAHTRESAKTITIGKLKNLLMTLGTGVRLTEDEVDAFLNVEFYANKNQDISFDDFIYKVLKE
ncbi:centrin, putative [Plasmodium knowlesi strain H]|uniref:Calmodulin n=3 Tax=Plasmodium knowlesi TaxID=5850 RepID=A0A5K1VQR4_PLAKH|nr:centrin, putative [Plasmodium knowlesi strain H]OTN68140.1 putative Centrin [Plasmodium knowlesi]CAA9986945.1 centrin, putative [Plasmodium knowlesi strain H]SBO26472.1 centrin, putative [Plasmodium knowlesi strain H]SBO28149.1 centrin, putative [Plasmodium knowlesi strain H]VVS76419.1 centrin, putative [Plasmodium knowlesi strain H]|eukprot:XP_002258192.1 centrin, putative [Plasmodium knowlesi strain H]